MNNAARAVLFTILVVAPAIAPRVVAAETQLRPKALMIMVDGLRADAVENAPMTNLLRLRDGKWQKGYRGFSSLAGHTLYDARPSSAANHAAIATGVTAAKTGVYKNGDTPNGAFARWPSWLARVVDARPEKKALYTYSWPGDAHRIRRCAICRSPPSSRTTGLWADRTRRTPPPSQGSWPATTRRTPCSTS